MSETHSSIPPASTSPLHSDCHNCSRHSESSALHDCCPMEPQYCTKTQTPLHDDVATASPNDSPPCSATTPPTTPLNDFFALWTVISVKGMFGNFRCDVFGNVFDNAFSCLFSFVEFGTAVGTTFEAMDLLPIGDGGGVSGAFVSRFCSVFFLRFFLVCF